MQKRNANGNVVSNLVLATVLLAAVGGAAFWAWSRAAPLSQRYRRYRRQSEDRERRGPNPQRNPGTVPV